MASSTQHASLVEKRQRVRKRAPAGVTVREVAQAAGVALSTVSAVLRQDQSCYASEKTRAKVMEAARQLGYRPNHFARALRGANSMTLGLLFESLSAPTITLAKLAPIEQLASEAGYRVLVANYYGNPARQRLHVQELVASRVDGIILVTADPSNADLIQDLTSQQMPLVTIDSIYDFPTPNVWFDRTAGARLQVEHMLSIGCKRLVFLASAVPTGLAPLKIQGYREALAAQGQRLEDHILVDLPTLRGQERYTFGSQAITRLIDQGVAFDGVVVGADSLAVGVLQALHRANKRIPEDVAVIGYDDDDFTSALHPPLATIHQPRDVGSQALSMLLGQITLKNQGLSWPAASLRLTPSLVVRESACRAHLPGSKTSS